MRASHLLLAASVGATDAGWREALGQTVDVTADSRAGNAISNEPGVPLSRQPLLEGPGSVNPLVTSPVPWSKPIGRSRIGKSPPTTVKAFAPNPRVEPLGLVGTARCPPPGLSPKRAPPVGLPGPRFAPDAGTRRAGPHARPPAADASSPTIRDTTWPSRPSWPCPALATDWQSRPDSPPGERPAPGSAHPRLSLTLPDPSRRQTEHTAADWTGPARPRPHRSECHDPGQPCPDHWPRPAPARCSPADCAASSRPAFLRHRPGSATPEVGFPGAAVLPSTASRQKSRG